MKLIISILTFPLVLALSLAGLGALTVKLLLDSSMIAGESATAHTVKGIVYVCIGSGLPLAIVSAVAGAALMVLAFIFKSWTRAVVTGGLGFLAVLLWLYFLEIPYPI